MSSKGFTLIELIITIVISMILLTIGVPSLRQFMTASAVEQESNNLVNALHSARSQAISLNRNVVLCYADNTNNCVTSAFTHLLMFVDKDGNGVLNTANADPDIVLLTGGSLNSSITVNMPQSNYQFTQEGMLLANTGEITLFNNQSTCIARKIILSLSGNIQLCDSSKAGINNCPSGSYCP
jgi:prepilin-type N-terminal cleavage/methylation domain